MKSLMHSFQTTNHNRWWS